MPEIDTYGELHHLQPATVAKVVARGLYDLHAKVSEEGSIVYQDEARLPPSTRRARHLLSGRALLDGCLEDYGASILKIMEMAQKPMRAWGLPSFSGEFEFGDTILLCADELKPLPQCRTLAEMAGDGELSEEHLFRRLRGILDELHPEERASNYTALRGFIVRNPAASHDALDRLRARLDYRLAPFVNLVYQRIPKSALHNGELRLCNRCGVPLWPSRRNGRGMGRCRLGSCRMKQGPLPGFTTVENPDRWHLVTGELLIYWVSPGIDEIQIFDALHQAGRDAELYPGLDEVDISVDGNAVGIDVKDWSCPISLGNHMPKLKGELALYDRKIVSVPDARVHLDPDYLKTIKRIYEDREIEIMTTSQTIRRLRKSNER